MTDQEKKKLIYLVESGEKLAQEINTFIHSKHVSASEALTAIYRLNDHFMRNYPAEYAQLMALERETLKETK